MTNASAIAVVDISSSGLLLRELSPGYVTLSGSAPVTPPVSVSANTANAGEVVQAQALCDDVFTLMTAENLLVGDKVQLFALGRIIKLDNGLYLGHAATSAKAGERVKVAVDLSSIYGLAEGGGGNGENPVASAPSSEPPEGNVVGTMKGAIYSQLDVSEKYKVRDWTFNGTVGTAIGWL